jgi:hypothetical protein
MGIYKKLLPSLKENGKITYVEKYNFFVARTKIIVVK